MLHKFCEGFTRESSVVVGRHGTDRHLRPTTGESRLGLGGRGEVFQHGIPAPDTTRAALGFRYIPVFSPWTSKHNNAATCKTRNWNGYRKPLVLHWFEHNGERASTVALSVVYGARSTSRSKKKSRKFGRRSLQPATSVMSLLQH